jgi:hypothetical protein
MNHYTEDSVISDMVLHSPDSTSSEDEDDHAATSPGELSDDSSTVVPLFHHMMAGAAAILCSNLRQFEQYVKRNKRRVYVRLDWDRYWKDSLHDPSFERDIRMKRISFLKLVDLLRDDLAVHQEMASIRGGEVSPELCVYLTIRYLSGGHYCDIIRFLGISPATFYYCLQKTTMAIVHNRSLQIVFPTSEDHCQLLARDYKKISYKEAIVNCVGCVDGYLLGINVPSRQQAGNVRTYFNGHYQKYGINVQTCCDSNCIFTYFELSALGSTNDRVAIKEEQDDGRSLHQIIEQLPDPYVIIGDAAYEPSEKLVSIFMVMFMKMLPMTILIILHHSVVFGLKWLSG